MHNDDARGLGDNGNVGGGGGGWSAWSCARSKAESRTQLTAPRVVAEVSGEDGVAIAILQLSTVRWRRGSTPTMVG